MKERSPLNIPPNESSKIGASYSRVSADGETLSLDQQPHINRDWMASISKRMGQNYIIKYDLKEPEGTSGKHDQRPEYLALIRLIKSKKIQFVVVKGLDRLGRKLRYFTEFIDICAEYGVELYINGMDADLSTPQGKLLLHMLGAVAEMERESIIYRSKSSIRSAMKTMGKIHGGCITLGYELDRSVPCGRKIVENEASDVRVVCDVLIKLRSYKETCRKLSELGIKTKTGKHFNKESIKRLLSNPILIGRLRIPETNELIEIPTQILSEEEFGKAQEVIKELGTQFGFRNKDRCRIYPLTGLLYTKAGNPFKGTSGHGKNGDRYNYYRSTVDNLSYRCEEIEASVIDSLFYLIKHSGLEKYRFKVRESKFIERTQLSKGIAHLEQDLKLISSKISKGTDAIMSLEKIDSQVLHELQNRIKVLVDERCFKEQELLKMRDVLENHTDHDSGVNSLEEFLNSNIAYYKDAKNLARLRGFLRRLISKVVVDHEVKEIKIFWSIEATQEEIRLPLKRELTCTSRGLGSSNPVEALMRDKLEQLSVIEKKTGSQISKELGVSRATVIKYQKRFGFQTRATGNNVRRKRGVSYGKKNSSNGKITNITNELNVIEAMKTWRGKGKSFREIATLLNDQKVPTKTGRGPWHGKTVHQILSAVDTKQIIQ